MRGKVLAADNSVRVLPMYPGFPMQDVEISYLAPSSKLVGLKAPYVVVLSHRKDLLTPARFEWLSWRS